MRLDEIKAVVGEEVADLEALYAQFLEEAGTQADPDQFLAYLRTQQRITDSRFRELHTRGTLVLKSLSTLATHVFGDDEAEVAPVRGDSPRYTFLGRIGHGAMGEVQVARDALLQRKIAVKRMHADLPKPRRMAARFLTEAQITAQLDHPNIVPVYALEGGEGSGTLSYTMKLIRGRTFEEVIGECRADIDAKHLPSTSLDDRLEHFLKVCDAMAYAHSRGVVHRDLKPENIMVGPFNEVYVMDWGIARIMDGSREDLTDVVELPEQQDVHRTRAGTVIGTPAYMSPEQAEGLNEVLDGRSDLFSLGLILYELVSLRRAVEGDSAVELMSRIQVRKLQPLRPYGRERIPTELKAIIDKATALEPDDRYPDVAALAADIRRYRKGEAVLARPDTPRQRVNRWVSRHRELVLLSIVALLCVIFIVVGGFTLHNLSIRDAAERREERLSALITTVGRQGHVIDGHLQHYEDVLNVFATSVGAALTGPPPPERATQGMAEEFSPPDLASSARYGRDISLQYPVFAVASGADPDAVQPSMDRLASVRGAFSRALLRSVSDDAVALTPAATRDVLATDGAPLAWAKVALDNGVLSSYPGHGGYSPGYDARKAPWYRVDDSVYGPQWGSPHIDLFGLGLVLPCSVPLRDPAGDVLGVASVTLTFDYVIDELLLPEGLPDDVEGFLVDDEGRIVIQSSEDRSFGERRYTRSLRLKRFDVPELVDAIAERESGYLEADGELVLFYRMNAIGWFYVLKGDAATLLE